MTDQELSMFGKVVFTGEDNEQMKEFAASSDAWFRGVMKAIRIINMITDDKAAVNNAIEQISEATGNVGYVRGMLKAVQILHDKSNSPDEFEESMKRITKDEHLE